MRRLVGATTAKVGLSTAGTLALLAIVLAFIMVRGYNQSLTPTVTSSVPASAQNWPVYQPVRIEFNKPMDHASVEENLQIWPPGERSRIPTSWDGNALILGSSASQSTLFLPDTTYQVMVLGTARDTFGHHLGTTWSLSFRTSPISNAARQQTPTATATEAAISTVPPTQVAVVPVVPPSPTSGAADPNQAGSSTEGTGNTSGAPQQAPATGMHATPTQVESLRPPAPTPAPRKATPTVTQESTPQPTPTPQPSDPTPAATPTVVPTTPTPPTATPTPTQASTAATPSPDVIPVTGAFGSVYWAHQDVQSKLGVPTSPETVMNAAELGFQRGTMYERFDTNEIYTFFSNRQWDKRADTWTPADGEGGGAGPDAGLWIPTERFGKIWDGDPGLASTIGFAVEQNAHLMDKNGGSVQSFTNGIMLYSDRGFVYVAYNDGSWELYPDTSGHGDLLTPTPEASGTPAATPANSGSTPVDSTPTATPSATSTP